MSDTAYNKFQQYGTAAQRAAFTPSPAGGTQPIYMWRETDTGLVYIYDTSWHLASGLFQLSQVVTSASQATVDFTSISQLFSSLEVIFTSQDTTAGTSSSNINLKVNNDGTSGNYTSASRVGTQDGLIGGLTLIAPSAAGWWIADNPNAGNTNLACDGRLLLPNYARTTFHKRYICNWQDQYTSGTQENYQTSGRWKSTAAISRLTFSCGTAFTDGSVFTLYGWV